MQYETERVLCAVDKDIARVAFKSTDVVEYTEAAKLGAELRHFVQGFQFQILVIDCDALDFVTSTVLEAFVSVHLRCRRMGRPVRIVNANALVRDMLVTTHLDRLIEVCDTMAQAMRLNDKT